MQPIQDQKPTARKTSRRILTGSIAAACAFASIMAAPSARAADGTWINDGSGLWSTTGNWAGGTVADGAGFTADFNTIDLTADRTVSLDTPRTIGNLIFGDTVIGTPGGWTLNNNGSALNILTLAGPTPTITVNALGTGKAATISAELAGTSGLTKSGAGKLVLSGANTYSGGTTLANGSLFVDATIDSALGCGTLTITSTGGPTTLGTSLNGTTLNNPVSVQSDFSVVAPPGGSHNFSLNGPVDLNGSTRVITGLTDQGQVHFGGVISNGGLTLTTSGLSAPVGPINSYVAFIMDGDSEHTYTGLTTVDANAFLVLQSNAVKLPGDVLIQGTGVVDYLGFSDQIADTATVTVNSPGSNIGTLFAGLQFLGSNVTDTIGVLNGSSVGTVGLGDGILTVGAGNFAGVIGDGGLGGQLAKNTVGTLTLSGVNTYTGATNVNGGTLNLDFSASGAPVANILDSSSTLVLGGGTLMLTGKAGTTNSQEVNGTSIRPGASGLNLSANTSNPLALNLGAITRSVSGVGGTMNITQPIGTLSTTNGVQTSTGSASTILRISGAAFATVGGNDWAAKDATNSFIVGLSTVGGYTLSTSTTLSGNADVAPGVTTTTLAVNTSNTSLRFNQNQSTSIVLGGNTLTTGGILVTSAVATAGSNITGGTIKGALSRDLVVIQNSAQPFAISAIIANNVGATGLTKSGSGTLQISGANTYTGRTTVAEGTLSAMAANTLGSGALQVVGGTLDISTFNNTVSAVTLTRGNINGTTGILTGTSYAVQSGAISAILGGSGIALNKTTTGTVTLAGANTYTGTTTVTAGTLAEASTGAIADASDLTVNGPTAVFDLGASHDDTVGAVRLQGGGRITGTGTSTLTSISSFELESGAVSASLAGGGIPLNKNTSGTVTLSGTNTYTGTTTINAGTLKAGSATAFAPGSAFSVLGGTLDLAGFSNSVASLGGASSFVQNSGATAATLTMGGNPLTVIYAGVIQDKDGAGVGSTLGIRKIGTNEQDFSGTNTYTGGTVLENGALFADNNSAFGNLAFGPGPLTITSAGGPTTLGTHLATTTLSNSISVQSDFSISGVATGDFKLSGPVDLNGATRVITGVTDQSQIHFGGVISNGGVTFTTSGLPAPVGGINSYVAFIYDGMAEHAYTGLTTVEANAFLVFENAGEKLRGDILIQGNGVVDYLNAQNQFLPDQISDTAKVTVNSPGSTISDGNGGSLQFAGLELRNNSDTIGALSGSSVGTVGLGSGVLTVGAGNFAGVIRDGAFGVGGQLTKNTTGTLTLSGANTYTGNTNINNGTLVLNGSVQSPTVFVNFAGTLMGTGTALHNVVNAGVFSPGHSPGTFHIRGNFGQTGAGTTVIEVAGVKPAEHDLIAVGGRATLGGNLRLVKLGGARLKVGDKVTFLTATGGVTGQFEKVTNPFATDTIVSGNVVYGPNEVSLEIQQGSFATLGSEIKLTPNQKNVGTALDRLVAGHREMKLIDFLTGEPLGHLPGDYDRIAPEELASMYAIGLAQANVQTANLQRRFEDVHAGRSGFSAEGLSVSGTGEQAHAEAVSGVPLAGVNGPTGQGGRELHAPAAPPDRRFGVFFTGVGEFAHVGDTSNARGYDLATGGFTLGVDYRLTPTITVGLNTGYARSGADLGGGGRVTVDGAKLGVYATYFDEGLYVDAALQGGYNNYDTRRTALQGTATGSTTGGEVNALIATGFDFTSDALRIGPTASFQYTHIGFGGYRESGSLAPLTFGSQASDSTRTAIGVKAAYEFRLASGVVVRPEGRAAWQHEFGDIAYAIDSHFASGGKGFTVQGTEIGRDSVLVGLGVAVLWNDRTSTYLYYDGEVGRANYTSNNVSGGVRMAF